MMSSVGQRDNKEGNIVSVVLPAHTVNIFALNIALKNKHLTLDTDQGKQPLALLRFHFIVDTSTQLAPVPKHTVHQK